MGDGEAVKATLNFCFVFPFVLRGDQFMMFCTK